MKNNYDATVPCHRVIRADGSLGGYNRGGTEKKKQLLEAEADIKEGRVYQGDLRKILKKFKDAT